MKESLSYKNTPKNAVYLHLAFRFDILVLFLLASIIIGCKSSEIKEDEKKEEKKIEILEYDKLQKVFSSLSFKTTIDEVETIIEFNGLKYRKQDHGGTSDRTTTYKIAYFEDVTWNKHAASGDYIEIVFDKNNGALEHANYVNAKVANVALLYNYGTYWDFREKNPNNRYSSHYYYKPGDIKKEGIVIQYSNGRSVKTGYYPCANAEDALTHVLK